MAVQSGFYYVVWPFGVLLAVIECMGSHIHWAGNGCLGNNDIVYESWMGIVIGTCIACYICSAIGMRTGFAVRRRIWFRAQLYIVATLISYGPYVICPYLVHHPFPKYGDWAYVYYMAMDGTLGLTGFLNCVVYVLTTRYGTRLRESSPNRQEPTTGMEPCASYDVAFNETVSVRHYDTAGTPVTSSSSAPPSPCAASDAASSVTDAANPQTGESDAENQEDDENYCIGELVEFRGARKQWMPGVVTCVSPLRVKPNGWESAHSWDRVRRANALGEPLSPTCQTQADVARPASGCQSKSWPGHLV